MRAILFSFMMGFASMCFGSEREPTAESLTKHDFIKISFGYDQMDEISFKKRSPRVWEARWLNREKTEREMTFRRALPAEIVVEDFSEFERLILRFADKITAREGHRCATRFNLEVGTESSPRNKIKAFCLDGLSRAENTQFGIWLKKMIGYF